jgi:hypothetical protein
MKLHPSIKIEAIVSKDKLRAVIQNPWIDTENGRLVATNGSAMAVIPVELDEEDEPGHVPCDAFKQARKGAKGEISMLCNGNVTLPSGAILPRDKSETPPNWQAVMPQDHQVNMKISLNAAMLAQLAEAMGTEGVTLEIEAADKTIVVKPAYAGRMGEIRPACWQAVGILMPIRQ